MATTPTIEIKRGDTWTRLFSWRTYDTDAIIDLTGCTARLQLRRPRTDYVSLELTSDGQSTSTGTLEIDGPSGNIAARAEAYVMAELTPGSYLADLEVTFTDGSVVSTDTFIVKVLEDVTR